YAERTGNGVQIGHIRWRGPTRIAPGHGATPSGVELLSAPDLALVQHAVGEAVLAGRTGCRTHAPEELGGHDAVLEHAQPLLGLLHLFPDRVGLRTELGTAQLGDVSRALRRLARAVQRFAAAI